MTARRVPFPVTSKMTSEVIQALLQLRDVALQLTEHAVSDLRKSANPDTRRQGETAVGEPVTEACTASCASGA
jgi:hypothetical protein